MPREPEPGRVDAAVVTVYRDLASEWRWRATDTNHEPVADSGEGYATIDAAVGAARDLFPHARLSIQR